MLWAVCYDLVNLKRHYLISGELVHSAYERRRLLHQALFCIQSIHEHPYLAKERALKVLTYPEM
jgi:hypothetical protein